MKNELICIGLIGAVLGAELLHLSHGHSEHGLTIPVHVHEELYGESHFAYPWMSCSGSPSALGSPDWNSR